MQLSDEVVRLSVDSRRIELLCRLAPSDDPVSRFDNLDDQELQDSVEEIKRMAEGHGFVVSQFAGHVATAPWTA